MLELYEILLPVGESGLTGNLADFMEGVVDFEDGGFIISGADGDILIPTNGEPSMLPLEDDEVVSLMQDYIIPEGMTLLGAIEDGVFDGIIPESILDNIWSEEEEIEYEDMEEEEEKVVVHQVLVAPKNIDLKEYLKTTLMFVGVYFVITKLVGMNWSGDSDSIEPMPSEVVMPLVPNTAPIAPIAAAPPFQPL